MPIDVLVVDDSLFARRAVVRLLEAEPDIRVVAQAADGREALRLIAEHAPDVVTLDLEMPGLDGLATLEQLSPAGRASVIVLSGAAAHSAELSLRSLDLGAFDVVAKPSGGPLALRELQRELVCRVRAAAGRAQASGPTARVAAEVRPAGPMPLDLIVIGVSTGGPIALQRVIAALPADFGVPILVLQHMPPGYTRALSERLNRASAIDVQEAQDGDRLLTGRVLVAPAGLQLGFRAGASGPVVSLSETCPVPSYYRPCIDHTFAEAARVFGARALAVVMTGMGADGALGVRSIRAAGGHVWAQDEATSTIYGMPRAALETGCVEQVFPLDQLARRLADTVNGSFIALRKDPA